MISLKGHGRSSKRGSNYVAPDPLIVPNDVITLIASHIIHCKIGQRIKNCLTKTKNERIGILQPLLTNDKKLPITCKISCKLTIISLKKHFENVSQIKLT